MLRITSPTTRFTADEFERMAAAGVFGDRRVELINGRIYRVPPQSHPHMMAVSKVTRALISIVPETEWLTIQGTIHLDRNTTVDPEFIWLAAPLGTPEARWPTPILLIEVSDSTYRVDSGVKLRKYAKAGISDYWIVNVRDARLEIYRDPQRGPRLADCRYASVTHLKAGDAASLLLRPDVTLAVAELLP